MSYKRDYEKIKEKARERETRGRIFKLNNVRGELERGNLGRV